MNQRELAFTLLNPAYYQYARHARFYYIATTEYLMQWDKFQFGISNYLETRFETCSIMYSWRYMSAFCILVTLPSDYGIIMFISLSLITFVTNYFIECANNTDPSNGNCLEGYAETDCCSCDTAGNDTHAFYMNDNGECIRKLVQWSCIVLAN